MRRMPLQSPSGAPTPGPALEGGEVLAAGRARALAAKSRNQPQALERISVSDAVKGSLRRATPALDSALNAHDAASLGWRVRRMAEGTSMVLSPSSRTSRFGSPLSEYFTNPYVEKAGIQLTC